MTEIAFMKFSKLFLILPLIVLTGAGCFGGVGKSTANDGGVFKTANGGTSWAQQAAIVSGNGVGSIATADILALAMDPQDSKAIYAGTKAGGMIYSLDGAATWQQARHAGLREGGIAAIAVDPTDVCTVYVAKGSRLFKSSDCLRSANPDAYVETRAGVTVSSIAVDWYDSKIVWIGLTNGDVLKSEDGTATWQTSVSAANKITAMLVSNADSRVVLLATAEEGFYKTIDSGATWTQIKDSLKELRNATKVASVVQDKAGATLLAATSYGLIRSKDFGSTWEGLQLLSAPGQVQIPAVAIDPANADTIAYAAGSAFYRSIDGGIKWTTTKIPSTRLPTTLLTDPTDPTVYFLGLLAPKK
jgi:photosystem II stability/assembly factor-like uncharacterized protein